MKKIKFIILTPYGNKYQLSKEGYVVKFSNGLDKSNANITQLKTWQIMGIREIKPFGRLGCLLPLNDAVKLKTFLFKNGKPKYTIQDIDHGTTRIIGNTSVHGVKSIYSVN